MYAVIRRYKIKNISEDELVRLNQQGFVPIVKQIPGFVAYHFINAGNDTVVTFSLFHDKAGAEESTRRAADWGNKNLASFMQGAPEVITGEVLIHEFK